MSAAGASGAIGTRLVPQLISQGHEVTGTCRSPGHAERIRALGAEAVALDLLDAGAVRQAVLAAQPEAIIHQATALADARFTRSLDKSFAPTNRLRTEGTDALLAAARETCVRRLVAQSFANYRYAREGGPVKAETDRLDPAPPASARLDQRGDDPRGRGVHRGGRDRAALRRLLRRGQRRAARPGA